jgi:hypothetical protein
MFMEFCLPRTRPFQKINPFCEQLSLKKNQLMSSVNNLELEIIELQENIRELKKEINFYS